MDSFQAQIQVDYNPDNDDIQYFADYLCLLYTSGMKYDIPHAHMFVIEGMEKVRDVIEKNRKRKLTKHKKLSLIHI